jgi:hypothetical protein
VAAALAGAVLIARMTWLAVAANLTVMRSWILTEGEVRAMNGAVEFELGREPDEYRALATVDHTWGLSLFKRAPLFVDPNDPKRIKTAGFLQMWLTPAGMSAFVLLLLSIAFMAARVGIGITAPVPGQQARGQWMFHRIARSVERRRIVAFTRQAVEGGAVLVDSGTGVGGGCSPRAATRFRASATPRWELLSRWRYGAWPGTRRAWRSRRITRGFV